MSTSHEATPRPGAWLRPAPAPGGPSTPGTTARTVADSAADTVADTAADDGVAERLRRLPVAEHADVLAAEHDRLHRLLATIDQL